ncbi:MAG: hypothetical protein ACRC0V_09310 [Fusobacteriaceae bacterium]
MQEKNEKTTNYELLTSVGEAEILDLETLQSNITQNNKKGKIENLNVPVFLGDCKLNVEVGNKFSDYFNLIFTSEFYNFLLNQINKRISRTNSELNKNELSNCSYNSQAQKHVKFVVLEELKYFVAINLYMGIEIKPEIKNYWEKNTNMYGSVFVQKLMAYSRYTEINTHLSLSSMEKSNINEKRDNSMACKKNNILFK